jgi:hypothetical protein
MSRYATSSSASAVSINVRRGLLGGLGEVACARSGKTAPERLQSPPISPQADHLVHTAIPFTAPLDDPERSG